jgi:hypothetical protein
MSSYSRFCSSVSTVVASTKESKVQETEFPAGGA